METLYTLAKQILDGQGGDYAWEHGDNLHRIWRKIVWNLGGDAHSTTVEGFWREALTLMGGTPQAGDSPYETMRKLVIASGGTIDCLETLFTLNQQLVTYGVGGGVDSLWLDDDWLTLNGDTLVLA